MRVRIAKERSDLTDLVSAAIKTTYHTRSPGGVDRCIDVLNQLKYLSLSVKEIQLSESIVKLESLTRHRNPKIRKETQDLFDSWLETLYAQGRDNSLKAGLTKFCLKPKKPFLTRCSELKKKQEQRSLPTHEPEEIKKETKTGLKPLNLKRRGDALEDVTTKKPRGEVKVFGNQKMCSVTSTALPQHSRQNIKDKDGRVTTKTLIPPPKRRDDEACKNVPRRPVYRKKEQQTGPVKDSGNPKSAAVKTKTKEMLEKKKAELAELFEEAKKAADVANAKGVLLGRAEASRCVEALSLLMRINITPKPKEPRRMMERLEGLTKHKYHKICNSASALLHLWRQRIKDQQRKESATKAFPYNSLKAH